MIRTTLFALALLLAIPAMAVTEKEMEEARTIAAQAYLRYANDGSGYLDDINPTTMSALESKLRAKEVENLKAFKSVKVPSDYASWDKARLVEFWGITFFSSPNLTDKGKLAKSRVKARIGAMNIGAATAADDKAAAEPAAVEAEVPASTNEPPAAEEVKAETPAVADATQQGEEILADQEAMAQDEAAANSGKESNSTWIYVVVLVLLIGAVVWLLVFASKMMRGGGDDNGNTAPQSDYNRPDERTAAPQPSADDKKNAALLRQYAATVDQLNADNDALHNELSRLKTERAQLSAQLAQMQSNLDAAHREIEALKAARTAPAPAAQPQPEAAPVAPVAPQPAPAPAPAPESEHPTKNGMPNIIYLGRANKQGLFVRADRRLTQGASIYRLDTSDGLVGTFHVVNHPEVVKFALANPVDNLERGCVADDLTATAGVTGIATESAGTAIFEGGCWKVLRKSRIRFE